MAIDETSIPFPLAVTPHAPVVVTEPNARRRKALFRESGLAAAKRRFWGVAYALMPRRVADLPFLMFHCAVDMLKGGTILPHPDHTHSRPDTFGGVCRDISDFTVLEAARRGFFPWCHVGPLKWWTRKQRMVLFLDEHHIAKRLRRDMKKAKYRVTFDEAFEDVISACAKPRSYNHHALTWITPEIMRLYTKLHDRGHAHSFEVWNEAGKLVGGGYGLSVGRVFVTESQFSTEPNTSKMGFAVLNYHLAKWGYVLNDGKDFTPTIAPMGFRLIPRKQYEDVLALHAVENGQTGKFVTREQYEALLKVREIARVRVGKWSVEALLGEVADWEPKGAAVAEVTESSTAQGTDVAEPSNVAQKVETTPAEPKAAEVNETSAASLIQAWRRDRQLTPKNKIEA